MDPRPLASPILPPAAHGDGAGAALTPSSDFATDSADVAASSVPVDSA